MSDQLAKLTRVRVFVASPGDVSKERDLLRKLVEDLNFELGGRRGYVLEFVGWKTHVYPEMGRLQGVINRQVPPCDIFIGIMWGRFGTPTGQYGSGTEEEFQIAYERWQREGSPKILFYFCDQPLSLVTQEQFDQYHNVWDFRQRLAKEKGLVWTYSDAESFPSIARRHLILAVEDILSAQDLLKVLPPAPQPVQPVPLPPQPAQLAPPPRRFTVFIASVRDLLEPVRAEIVEELNLRDIEILRPAGDREATSALMAEAHLCIHLLDGECHPVVDEQLDLSCAHARRQILWLSPRIELSPEDPDPYRRKLLALQSRDGDFDFMRCRHETEEIVERVEFLKQEWFKRNNRGIFFNIHGTDKRYAKELFQYLKTVKKIEPLMNENDLGEPTDREFDEKASRSRAVVVFYGTVSAAWVFGRLREAVKLIYSRGYPIETLGVYLAPPPKSGAAPIRLPVGFRPLWMDNTQGFDPSTLEELFVNF